MMKALQKETGAQAPRGRSGISLADLKARLTPVEWFEGIAVIQEVCRVLVESGVTAEQASVGPEEVVIDPSGSVHVGFDREEGEPVVRQVGDLLQLVLADS